MSKQKVSKVVAPNQQNGPDFLEKLGSKALLAAMFLTMFVAFFVFKDFILLKKLYLFKDIGSDTLNGAYPFFYNFAYYFNEEGLPTWSFYEGMGQNIVGGFLRDPFMLIGYLAGANSMPKIYVFVEIFKILSAGMVFYLYLKQLKVSNYAAIVGCLLFTFSGFMIIGSCWYVFTYEAFTVALALLGFELYFQKSKWLVFVISIAAIAISMPFNLYVTGIILLFYMLFRLGQTQQFNFKSFFQLSLKLAVLGVIGLLIAAPFLLEASLQLVESPRGSGTNSYKDILTSQPMFSLISRFEFGTFVARLFSSDYLGSGSNFKGWQNFLEAPVSYCGVISLLLMPQVFGAVNKASRRWYFIWLGIWLVPTLFPYFRHAFWLFTGDYYRIFSFCVSLVFIVYSVYALDLILKTRKINLITLIASLVGCFILLGINYFKDTQAQPDDTVALLVKAFLVGYALILYFLTKQESQTPLKYLLLGILCVEMISLSGFTINRRDAVYTRELKEKTGYNDYSVEAVDYIKKQEKTAFFRIDKNYYSSGAIHGSLNDNKIHKYFGTSSYSSFANNNYISYLKGYGVIGKTQEYETRWAPGLINRPILESLNNVDYIMAKAYSNPLWRLTHDSVAKFGDVLVLKNKFTLPFGYTYDKVVKQSDFDRLSNDQKDYVSLQACVVNDEEIPTLNGLTVYPIADTIQNLAFSFDKYAAYVSKLKESNLSLKHFSQKQLSGTITTNAPRMMYLSFPYDKGWHLTLNGVETPMVRVNNGMTGVFLPKGTHQLELDYRLRLFNKGIWMIPIGLICMLVLFVLSKKGKNPLKYSYAGS